MSKLVDALRKSRALQVVKQPTDVAAKEEYESDSSEESMVQDVLESTSHELRVIEEQWLVSQAELEAKRIIHGGKHDSDVEQAFRDLRTSILEKTAGSNSTILVTSAASGGGASFVTINLACAFALDRKRTGVVIDCNLKNPAYYMELIANKGAGLTDYLDDRGIGIESILYKSGIPRVRMIPVGQNSQSQRDYFTDVAMKKLLRDIKRRYKERYIFLDAPSINESAAARALAKLCDYAILVVPYGGATEDEIRLAAQTLGADKLLGTVFNNQPSL